MDRRTAEPRLPGKCGLPDGVRRFWGGKRSLERLASREVLGGEFSIVICRMGWFMLGYSYNTSVIVLKISTLNVKFYAFNACIYLGTDLQF